MHELSNADVINSGFQYILIGHFPKIRILQKIYGVFLQEKKSFKYSPIFDVCFENKLICDI